MNFECTTHNNNKTNCRRNRIAQRPPHQQQQERNIYEAQTLEKLKTLVRKNLHLLQKIALGFEVVQPEF